MRFRSKCLLVSCIGAFWIGGCASAPRKTDIVIRDFTGDYGSDVRQAIESKVGTVKQFRIIASDSSSMAVVQEEAVKGKNRDDLFTKQDVGVKLGEGLAGSKVIHGSCSHTKNRHHKRVGPLNFPPLIGWLIGLQYTNEETEHELTCRYRLINAETHVQEAAGDTSPRSWSSDDDNAGDPNVVRKIASEIVDDIKEKLE